LAAKQIAISMDGRGRCMDNIFIVKEIAQRQSEIAKTPVLSGLVL
jgi:hypothetical protein